ncbi:hypothetical protein ACU4GD_00530 [Cupriavidus basilensis]
MRRVIETAPAIFSERACQAGADALVFAPSQHQQPRCKAGGTRDAGLAGVVGGAKGAAERKVKNLFDETLIALHNLVSLLQQRAATR